MPERLTRSYLRALKIEDEDTVTAILEAHTETTSALLKYKADAEKLPGVQKELDDLKKQVAENGDAGWKEKHDAVKKEFDDYKAAQTAKDTKAAKETAYRAQLKKAGVAERWIDPIIRLADLDEIEVVDGKVQNEKEVQNTIKTRYGDYIPVAGQAGADMAKPPANTGSNTTMTKDQIMAIKDPTERQAAIAENHQLFGI